MKSLIKIKPRKYSVGDVVRVDFIAIHPMDTGLRKDKEGKVIPANYIEEVKFYFNDEMFTQMAVWESVSTNPYLSVNFKVPESGKITAKYKTNLGESGEKSKRVKPKG